MSYNIVDNLKNAYMANYNNNYEIHQYNIF